MIFEGIKPVFKTGNVLFVSFENNPSKKIKLTAVPAKRDNYFCYDCELFSYCNSFQGNSPIAIHCFDTNFVSEENVEKRWQGKAI